VFPQVLIVVVMLFSHPPIVVSALIVPCLFVHTLYHEEAKFSTLPQNSTVSELMIALVFTDE
jgi:hypothetical protein